MGEIAAELFPDYLQVGPVRSPDVVIEIGTAGPHFEIRGPEHEQTVRLDEAAATDELERRLATALLAGRRSCYHLHSAALATDAGAILVMGASGAGKSTLAFRWLMSGRPLLGDDVVTIDEGGRVRDFRRRVKVHVDRVREAGLAPSDTVLWRPDYDECWVDPRLFGGWGGTMGVAALVKARFDPSRPPSLDAVPASEGLAWLLDGAMETGESPEGAFARLAAVAEKASSFRLVFDDAAEAVESLASLLQPAAHR